MAQPRIRRRLQHKGRLKQIPIYLGKFFRMFIYMDDWKVLPMAAIIAGLVAFVAGQNMFKNMEGCMMGSLALTCICIWNGFFNSIQVVCRERDIVKREHRSGMHITSYICAHVIYQAFLCLLQTIITVAVCSAAGMNFPEAGYFTPYFKLDIGITILLVTFSADMLSLMISCIARTTTAAMTIMPFMLIFELLFSGSVFKLSDSMSKFTELSIAKWGLNCMCAQAGYNSLPMITVWNQMVKFSNVEFEGMQPLKEITVYMQQNNLIDEFCMQVGANSQNLNYVMNIDNVGNCWLALVLFAFFAICVAIIALERIDNDKR